VVYPLCASTVSDGVRVRYGYSNAGGYVGTIKPGDGVNRGATVCEVAQLCDCTGTDRLPVHRFICHPPYGQVLDSANLRCHNRLRGRKLPTMQASKSCQLARLARRSPAWFGRRLKSSRFHVVQALLSCQRGC
jgi:hypothetical protein